MSKKMRILLVGDFKDELITFISNLEGIDVCGHLLNAENAISDYDALGVDMILMDVIMPGMSGLEAARWIKEQTAKVRIVLLSEHLNYEFLMTCVELKLDGCVLKTANNAAFAETLLSCRDLSIHKSDRD
jgi:DNA-binding NarL/FixJ family response regulator